MRFSRVVTIETDANISEFAVESYLRFGLGALTDALGAQSPLQVSFSAAPDSEAGIDPLDFIYDSVGNVIGANPRKAAVAVLEEGQNHIEATVTDGVVSGDAETAITAPVES